VRGWIDTSPLKSVTSSSVPYLEKLNAIIDPYLTIQQIHGHHSRTYEKHLVRPRFESFVHFVNDHPTYGSIIPLVNLPKQKFDLQNHDVSHGLIFRRQSLNILNTYPLRSQDQEYK
jgi:hypothetical protein